MVSTPNSGSFGVFFDVCRINSVPVLNKSQADKRLNMKRMEDTDMNHVKNIISRPKGLLVTFQRQNVTCYRKSW